MKFGTVAGTIVSDAANQIVAASPVESPGTLDVTVSSAGGTSATTSVNKFTCVAAPVVTGVSPTSGPTTGGTTVTVAGTNLLNATVDFGTVAATNVTSHTANTIVVASPSGTGAVSVTVTTVGGVSAASSADAFTYIPEPTLTVAGVAQNETTPTAASGTAFGQVAMFQQATQTFTIVNQGSAPLQLSGAPLVAIGGPQAGDFQVTQPPAATIAAGGSTTFSVAFAPQAIGSRSATLTIRSNAFNAPSCTFAINGTALAVPPVLNTRLRRASA